MNIKIENSGRFFIIGGAASTCYASLLEAAGGNHSSILILPHASMAPRQSANRNSALLRAVGALNVDVLMPRSALIIPPQTKVVLLAGGDQSRLVRKLGQPGTALLRDFLEAGGLLAGTSAGAASLGNHMITGGMADGVVRKSALCTGTGFGLLPRLIIDTHFLSRARFNRLAAAISMFANTTGIGLDEDTAVLIDKGVATVIGKGHVWLVRRDSGFTSNIERNGVGTVTDILVSIYGQGDSLNF